MPTESAIGQKTALKSLLLALLILLSTSSFAQTPDAQGDFCPGDVNLDGDRGLGDLVLIISHLQDDLVLEDAALANADVNGDLVVDIGDVLRLQQHTTGENPLVPCGEFDPEVIPCPGFSLGQISAQPLERVGLGTLPPEFEGAVLALVLDESQQFSALTFVLSEEDGASALFTPFHPSLSIEGGSVTVQVTDGTRACEPLNFAIESIPSAPGEFGRLVDSLEEAIRLEAQEFDLSLEDLSAGGPDLPTYAVPLAVAQGIINGPDNPDSLRAISEGTAPFLEEDGDNTSLDAIVNHLRLGELVGVGFQDSSAAPQAAPQTFSPCGISATTLDFCMRKAVEAERKLNPPDDGFAVKKLKEDAALAWMVMKWAPRGIGTALKIGEFAYKRGKKNIKDAQSIGLVTAMARMKDEASAYLLPSSFSNLDFQLFPAEMEEDRENGAWAFSELTAVSKGWKLDARRVAEYAAEKLNVKQVLGKGEVVAIRKIAEFTGNLPEGLSYTQQEQMLVDLVVEQGKQIAPQYFDGQSAFEIPPQAYGPVEIDDDEWSRSDVRAGAIAKLEHELYEPVRVGTGTLIVRVRTDGGKFGGVSSISKGKNVEVKPIVIRVTPDEAVLSPRQEKEFTVTVENSYFPNQIKVEAESGQASVQLGEGNTHKVAYTAPAAGGFPDFLTATHTARTGARKTGDPARVGVAVIKAEPSVIVLPEKGCVDPGEKTDVFHSVEGVEDQRVDWELTRVSQAGSAGDITAEGLFTAPDFPGIILVTATSKADGRAKGEATIKVGGCDCWWSVQIDGRSVLGEPGKDKGTFVVQADQNDPLGIEKLVSAGFDQLEGSIGNLGGVFQFTPAEPGSVTVFPGSYFFHVNGTIGLPIQPGDFLYATPEDAPLLGLLSEFGELVDGEIKPTIMEGSISGPVLILKSTPDNPEQPVEERPGFVSVRFKISADPQFPLASSCFVE